ncbi:polyphosphate polymerase domain-containing protein [Candidatus Saccharibacteria bacterium]|nr:polyphosphate polymerase domain-containing protein [Candidatus Saccharibacteria bacterium]
MNEKVFDRIEKKYLITKSQKEALLALIQKNMTEDNYFHSDVMNIYFDNDNYDLIVQSIDRPVFKEKLRARSYGGYDRVFIEIKTKMKGAENNIGYKRRVMITHDDYQELIHHHTTLEELAKRSIETVNDLQIAKEADYLINQFNLKPKIFISYDRESYKNDENLRITFDENLKFRNKDLSFIRKKRDKIYFKTEPNIIMEIKADGVMPLWLVKKMSELHIYPQQFSKIGKIYTLIRKEQNV